MKIFKKKTKKIILYDIKIFTLATGVIMIWRWIWNFLDHYFLPNDFILSNISVIIIWVLVIILIDYDLEALWEI